MIIHTSPAQLPVAVGVTGASGAIYAVRLVDRLAGMGIPLHLVVSEAGRMTLKDELGVSPRQLAKRPGVTYHAIGEIGAAVASGSYRLRGTVICPCSAKSLGEIALGVGDNLIARMGHVALKERWPLIVVPRETPYALPLIENMKRLALAGANILPASPSFYRHPQTIDALVDTVIDRALTMLGLESFLTPWPGLGVDDSSVN